VNGISHKRLLMPLLLVMAFAGIASAAERGTFESALRYRKTLLSWNTNVEPREDDDNRLVTDRPHISEASSLVGLGRVQLETGYSYFRDANAGTVGMPPIVVPGVMRVRVGEQVPQCAAGAESLPEP
jgi:hypothetical protein